MGISWTPLDPPHVTVDGVLASLLGCVPFVQIEGEVDYSSLEGGK